MIKTIKYKITDLITNETYTKCHTLQRENTNLDKAFDRFLRELILDCEIENCIIGVDEKEKHLYIGNRDKNFYEISDIEFLEN